MLTNRQENNQEETDEYNQNFSSHAIRHADAYRALSDFPDHHLGWLNLEDKSYSIRERCPYKRDFDTTQLSSKAFLLMAKQWAETTVHLLESMKALHWVDQMVVLKVLH